MSLDQAAVTKIARLARIRVNEAEKESLGSELSRILTWIEQLQEVNTDDVPLLASVCDTSLPWREDKVTDGHKRDDILANAPASDYGCFVVPKVIE
jgi:aspartyl-tRNA(Asn)/glutamyl-tRNA(Gln) amidotransferase subunit C